MKLTEDIKSPWLIHTKAALFAVAGVSAGAMLLAQMPTLRAAMLLGIAIWAFCRVYYYFFYVIERYLGRERRFAGVFDALRFVMSGRGREN